MARRGIYKPRQLLCKWAVNMLPSRERRKWMAAWYRIIIIYIDGTQFRGSDRIRSESVIRCWEKLYCWSPHSICSESSGKAIVSNVRSNISELRTSTWRAKQTGQTHIFFLQALKHSGFIWNLHIAMEKMEKFWPIYSEHQVQMQDWSMLHCSKNKNCCCPERTVGTLQMI